jgi:hypothetical protein
MKPQLQVLILLFVVSMPVAAQRSATSNDICYALEGHATQRECQTDRAEQSELRLESAEKATRDTLLRADAERGEIERAAEAFDQTVSSYRRYRTEQCDFVGLLAFGGNARGDRQLLCEIELNETRIQYLEADAKSVP